MLAVECSYRSMRSGRSLLRSTPPFGGDAVAELRPMGASEPLSSKEHLSPREALRCLHTEARLTPGQAQQYLTEVYDERLADQHDSLGHQLWNKRAFAVYIVCPCVI